MKKLTIFNLVLLSALLTFGQDKSNVFFLDTTTYHFQQPVGEENYNNIEDTIFYCKRIIIDSIITQPNAQVEDTLFYVEYFDRRNRYQNDTFIESNYCIRIHGFMYKNKKVGKWDYTHNNPCFEQGTLGIDIKYYFYDELITGIFEDEYYYLKDSIRGKIVANQSVLPQGVDTLHFECSKNVIGEYICSISVQNGVIISKTTLPLFMDEIESILGGYKNREIKKTIDLQNLNPH